MGLAGYKTISILSLVVLVALAGGSPAFATDGAFITLDPAAACPGAMVIVRGNIPFDSNGDLIFPRLYSVPIGLVPGTRYKCLPATGEDNIVCSFSVSESASCGRYEVIVTLENIGSASAVFDVAGPCCPAVGGCVQPVNTFAMLSPWLAAIGLIGCIGTVAVVAKKRQPEVSKP
jgi:hypothetical protein